MATSLDKSLLCPILVGRAPIIESFKQLIERAREGQAQITLLSGEAGIGKSRLTAGLKAQATAQGFAILQGHCFEPDRTLPYAPFLDLLRSFCATHSSEATARAFGPNLSTQTQNAGPLLTLLPELAEHLPNIEPASPLEPEQEKRRLFQSFTHFFTQHSAARTPAGAEAQLIIIEDLHWCDEDSFDLLLHLMRRLAARPVLFALTYRHDEPSPALQRFLAELDRARLASAEFALARLSVNDVEAMIRAIFGQPQPVHFEFVNAIHALTEGNPFFVEETLKALVAAGDIYQGASGWARKPLAELQSPRTVHDAVQRRTRALSPQAARLLTLAAVAGRRFDFTLLQHLTGHDEPRLIALIKELIAAQLVVEESADLFAFRHALTRQVVYTSLLARERKTLHFTIAEMMERLYADSLESRLGELAYQYFEAGVWGKALGYAGRAGEKARNLYAQRAAIEHFTRAITAAQTLSAHLPLPNLFLARGQAHETLGEFEAAREDYERLLLAAHDDPAAQWPGLLALGFLWAGRDLARAGDYFRQALAGARAVNDPALIAHSLNRLGNWHLMIEQPLQARGRHEEALAIFQSLADRPGLAETLDLLGTTSISAVYHTEGAAHYQRAIALFRELDDRHGLASALTMLALCCGQYLGNVSFAGAMNSLAQSIAYAEEALALARSMGWRSAEALALSALGQALSAGGQYGPALDAMHEGLDICIEIEHQQWRINAHLNLGALCLDLLELPAARAHLDQSLALARSSRSLYWMRTATGFWASTCIQQGDLSQAASALQAVLPPEAAFVTMGERHSWAAQAELALAQHQPAQAVAIVDQLIAALPETEPRVIPRLALLRGAALLALGRAEEAEAGLRAALETARAQETPNWQWRAHAALARLYHAQKRDQAGQEAEAGKALVELLAASITEPALRENFVRQALASFPPSPKVSVKQSIKKQFGGLTAREREVAARVAQGKTNRLIAEEMVVSERTVEKHVENIMAKLGFDSRARIAAWASAKGLAGIEKGLAE